MYTIEARYKTGDSFSSREESTILGVCWQDKELAIQGLNDLTEHYRYYQKHENGYQNKFSAQDAQYVMAAAWYSGKQKKKIDTLWHHSAQLLLDSGERRSVDLPYVGYFEHLHELCIIPYKAEEDELPSKHFY